MKDEKERMKGESEKVKDESRRSKFILHPSSFILLLGLALRLWGLGWSLPDTRHPLATYHPDELINLNAARTADIPRGKFDIGFYNYGAFYFYLVSLSHTVGRGWGAIPATPEWPVEKPPLSETEPLRLSAKENAALFYTGRLVTALLGTATILVIFALGNRLFGPRAGLLAALLYALAPLAVVHAHFLTVDVPATFFVALALLAGAGVGRWVSGVGENPIQGVGSRQSGVGESPTTQLPNYPTTQLPNTPVWKDYALAGVWCGLAAATKYNAGLVLIAPLAAHFMNTTRRSANLGVLAGVFVLTFLVACPGVWLNFDAFWNGTYPGSGVRYELLEHARSGHGDLFLETGLGWWYHLVVSLRYGFGDLPLLVILAGVAWACARRTPQDKMLLAFLLLYYLTTGLSAVRFARYMIPLFPVLCVFAGRLLASDDFKGSGRLVLRLLTVGVLCTMSLSTFSLIHLMALPDPRDTAADYLEKTAPQGASIAFAKVPWFFSPPLSPLFGAPAAPQRARAAQDMTRFQLRIPTAEWDTSVLDPPPDFVVFSDLETLHAVTRLHQPEPTRFMQAIPPDYRRIVFAPPSRVFLPLPLGPLFPEDLLYIMPTLTIRQKSGGQ